MGTMEQNSFLQTLMVSPKKPDFIGYNMETEDLFRQMVSKFNEIMGEDLSVYCSHDFNDDDMQMYFYFDEDSLESEREDYDEILHNMPFDYDCPWEASDYLAKKIFGVDTWAYVQGRYHDSSVVEVQIGVPRNL